MKRFDAGFSWLNPPASYEDGGRQATVTTRDKTDFWRNTFYGFRHDNGHFLFKPVSGDFSAEVTIRGKYSALYDQAGLMLRIDEERWVKAGIEFTDGETHFSVVVTDGHSDWSVVPMAWAVQSVTLRVTKHAEAIRIQYKDPAGRWQMARLAHFPLADTVNAGIMCCSPERAGFAVTFDDLIIGPAIARALHK
jgi:regulation of enolase protein 1 (concanavalin A-like superfamily)